MPRCSRTLTPFVMMLHRCGFLAATTIALVSCSPDEISDPENAAAVQPAYDLAAVLGTYSDRGAFSSAEAV